MSEGIRVSRWTTAEGQHLSITTCTTTQMSSCRKKRRRKWCGRSRPPDQHQWTLWSTDQLTSSLVCLVTMMWRNRDLQHHLATVSFILLVLLKMFWVVPEVQSGDNNSFSDPLIFRDIGAFCHCLSFLWSWRKLFQLFQRALGWRWQHANAHLPR